MSKVVGIALLDNTRFMASVGATMQSYRERGRISVENDFDFDEGFGYDFDVEKLALNWPTCVKSNTNEILVTRMEQTRYMLWIVQKRLLSNNVEIEG